MRRTLFAVTFFAVSACAERISVSLNDDTAPEISATWVRTAFFEARYGDGQLVEGNIDTARSFEVSTVLPRPLGGYDNRPISIVARAVDRQTGVGNLRVTFDISYTCSNNVDEGVLETPTRLELVANGGSRATAGDVVSPEAFVTLSVTGEQLWTDTCQRAAPLPGRPIRTRGFLNDIRVRYVILAQNNARVRLQSSRAGNFTIPNMAVDIEQ